MLSPQTSVTVDALRGRAEGDSSAIRSDAELSSSCVINHTETGLALTTEFCPFHKKTLSFTCLGVFFLVSIAGFMLDGLQQQGKIWNANERPRQNRLKDLLEKLQNQPRCRERQWKQYSIYHYCGVLPSSGRNAEDYSLVLSLLFRLILNHLFWISEITVFWLQDPHAKNHASPLPTWNKHIGTKQTRFHIIFGS